MNFVKNLKDLEKNEKNVQFSPTQVVIHISKPSIKKKKRDEERKWKV